jgi:tetratricopeptide (TPR) repeat protein
VFLPALLAPIWSRQHLFNTVMVLVAMVWLGFAVANIRATVPLWADELALWQWALRQDPLSITAKDHLLSTYISRNDHTHARELADELVATAPSCPVCMLNAASLAISENDASRAQLALGQLDHSKTVAHNKELFQGYVFAKGELLELQGDLPSAEEAYRSAIDLDARNPVARVTLAMLLAREGRVDEARSQAGTALALFAPDERDQRRAAFEQALAAGTKSR